MPISTANSGTANNVRNSEDVLFSPGSSLQSVRIRVTDQPLHISGVMPPNHYVRVEREYDGSADPNCIDIPALPVMCKDGCNPLMLFNVPNPDCEEGRFIQSDIWLFYQGTYRLYYEVGPDEPAITVVPDDVYVWYKADKLVSKMGINLPLCGENQCPPSCMPEHVIELTCENGPCAPTDGPDCLRCETPVAYWRDPDNPQRVCLFFWVAPQGATCAEGVEEGRWEMVCLNECPPLDEDIVLGDGKEIVYCGPDGTTVRGQIVCPETSDDVVIGDGKELFYCDPVTGLPVKGELACPDPGPGVELGDQSAVFLRCNPNHDPDQPTGPDNPTLIADPILCPPTSEEIIPGDGKEILYCNPDFDPDNPGDPANPPIVKGPIDAEDPCDTCCDIVTYEESSFSTGICIDIETNDTTAVYAFREADFEIGSGTSVGPAEHVEMIVQNTTNCDAIALITLNVGGYSHPHANQDITQESIVFIVSDDINHIRPAYTLGFSGDPSVSAATIPIPDGVSILHPGGSTFTRGGTDNLIIRRLVPANSSITVYAKAWYQLVNPNGVDVATVIHAAMTGGYILTSGAY